MHSKSGLLSSQDWFLGYQKWCRVLKICLWLLESTENNGGVVGGRGVQEDTEIGDRRTKRP
jgi:hypothetical protein